MNFVNVFITLFLLSLHLNCFKSDNGDEYEWIIEFETSTSLYAGTNADVFVILHGTKRNTRKMRIKSQRDELESGQINRYELELDSQIGQLKYITIGIENFLRPYSDWTVKRVEIRDKQTNSLYLIQTGFSLTRLQPVRRLLVELAITSSSYTNESSKEIYESPWHMSTTLLIFLIFAISILVVLLPAFLIWYYGMRRLSMSRSDIHSQTFNQRQNESCMGNLLRNNFKRTRREHEYNNVSVEPYNENIVPTAPTQRIETVKNVEMPPNYKDLFPN